MKIPKLTRLVCQLVRLLGAIYGILKLVVKLIDMASNYRYPGCIKIGCEPLDSQI